MLVSFIAAVCCCLCAVVASSPVESLTKHQLRALAEAQVAKINKSQKKWTAKVHPLISEMSDAEYKQLLGLRRDPAQHAKLVAERRIAVGEAVSVKNNAKEGNKMVGGSTIREGQDDFFDARKEWPECADVIRKIQNQAYCGSCWAVSSASVMQDRICIQSGGRQKVDISAADLMSCVPLPSQGCNGGEPYQAFEYWFEHGVCTGSNYTLGQGCKPYPVPPNYPREHLFETPVCTRHCENRQYGRKYQKDQHFGHSIQKIMYNEEEDIMAAIKKGGPVVVGFAVYSDFRHYSSGVYEHGNDAEIVGAHAVRVIGWGYDQEAALPYWLVANSWGTNWGWEGGYFKIARGQDECFIESWDVNYGDATLD